MYGQDHPQVHQLGKIPPLADESSGWSQRALDTPDAGTEICAPASPSRGQHFQSDSPFAHILDPPGGGTAKPADRCLVRWESPQTTTRQPDNFATRPVKILKIQHPHASDEATVMMKRLNSSGNVPPPSHVTELELLSLPETQEYAQAVPVSVSKSAHGGRTVHVVLDRAEGGWRSLGETAEQMLPVVVHKDERVVFQPEARRILDSRNGISAAPRIQYAQQLEAGGKGRKRLHDSDDVS